MYSDGVKAASNVRMEDADKLLKAAVAIDPSFAEAYMWLAHVSGHLGRKVEREQYFKLAQDNSERLSERHRLGLGAGRNQTSSDEAEGSNILHGAKLGAPRREIVKHARLRLAGPHIPVPDRDDAFAFNRTRLGPRPRRIERVNAAVDQQEIGRL